jgi:hypothetical protein
MPSEQDLKGRCSSKCNCINNLQEVSLATELHLYQWPGIAARSDTTLLRRSQWGAYERL